MPAPLTCSIAAAVGPKPTRLSTWRMERWSLPTGAAVGQVARAVAAIAEARKARALVAAMVSCLDRPSRPEVEWHAVTARQAARPPGGGRLQAVQPEPRTGRHRQRPAPPTTLAGQRADRNGPGPSARAGTTRVQAGRRRRRTTARAEAG